MPAEDLPHYASILSLIIILSGNVRHFGTGNRPPNDSLAAGMDL